MEKNLNKQTIVNRDFFFISNHSSINMEIEKESTIGKPNYKSKIKEWS